MRLRLHTLIAVSIFAIAVACQPRMGGSGSASEGLSYNFQIRPILSDKCFACHGPDANKREAGLRLDIASEAYASLKENPDKVAISPGNPSKSEVILRIESEDEAEKMPPPESHLQLSETEKQLIIQWIEEGAVFEDHWSFTPLKAQESPIQHSNWEANEIDAFVLEAMESQGLTPSSPASKEKLARRLSFSLRGLPPTIEEIDHFVQNQDDHAYEMLIDQFMADSAYGERMAANWLDVARYADSDGYLDDKHRELSPWRDWVIEAFNKNMPYDQFITWQMAGDLIPDADQKQVLATAFNRFHKKNSEAGIVFEEFRTEYVADRTNTFGKAMLGLSLECARCHDHKYDPISQQSYFEFASFFNSTDEHGHAVYGPDQTPPPALMLTDEETELRIAYLHQQEKKALNTLEGQKKDASLRMAPSVSMEPNIQAIEDSLSKYMVAYYSFDQLKSIGEQEFSLPNEVDPNTPGSLKAPLIKKGIKGDAFFTTDYNRGILGEKIGWYERTEPFSLDFWLYPDTIYEEAGVLTHCENMRLGYKGYSVHLSDNHLKFIMAHTWPQNAIEIHTHSVLPVKKWTHISLSYDGSSTAEGLNIYINGKREKVEIIRDQLYKGILFEWNIHTYGFSGMMIGQRDKIIPYKYGGIDELKVFDKAISPLEAYWLHFGDHIPSIEKEDIVKHLLAQDQEVRKQENALREIRRALNTVYNAVPEIMVMGDLAEPRPTHILSRGNYAEPTQEVFPNTPSSILSYDPQWEKNRMGLSNWMFDRNNPLISRVIVNRIWQIHFGNGLVKTSDDFGNQGELPSHPALLDWLSNWFINSGWDIKALHKKILLSATYRQSGKMDPEKLAIDPENTFLSRGPFFRLDAEMVRDHLLASSQLLVRKIGGPSTYPYQPEGLWDELTNKNWRYRYLQESGEGLYRRSLYTIWKRTSPPPSMQILDIANRDICTVKRVNTSTPLQALLLLNDPQYVEAARAMALSYMQEGFSGSGLLEKAFRQLSSRTPTSDEQLLFSSYFQQELEHFKNESEKTTAYLSIGSLPLEKGLDQASLAAYASTIHAMMNTEEVISN